MTMELYPTLEQEEEDGFIPLSDFYCAKPKPKPVAISRRDKVAYGTVGRTNGTYTANVYIGADLADKIKWHVGEKLATFFSKDGKSIRVRLARPGDKKVSTLLKTSSEKDPALRFNFAIRKQMNLPMLKFRNRIVNSEVRYKTSQVNALLGEMDDISLSLLKDGKNFVMSIDIPVIEEADTGSSPQADETGETEE